MKINIWVILAKSFKKIFFGNTFFRGRYFGKKNKEKSKISDKMYFGTLKTWTPRVPHYNTWKPIGQQIMHALQSIIHVFTLHMSIIYKHTSLSVYPHYPYYYSHHYIIMQATSFTIRSPRFPGLSHGQTHTNSYQNWSWKYV